MGENEQLQIVDEPVGPAGSGKFTEASYESRPATRFQLVLAAGLFLLYLLAFIAAVHICYEVWPNLLHNVEGSEGFRSVTLDDFPFIQDWKAETVEGQYLLMVIAAAIMGTTVSALVSLATYLGNRAFRARWAWWYVMRLPIGLAVALGVYFLIRGGLLNVGAETTSLNPYAIVGISFVAGWAAKVIVDVGNRRAESLARSAMSREQKADDRS